MAQPKKTTVAGGAALVGIAGVVGHLSGALHGVEENLPFLRNAVAHGDSWSAAASTLKNYARGDYTERAVAGAACSFASAYIHEQPDAATIARGMWARLPVDPTSPEARVYSPLVTKATNAIYLAEQNGGLAANYVRICVLPYSGQ